MTVRAWLEAMTVDRMIAIYLGLVVVVILVIGLQMVGYVVQSWHAKRRSRHIVQFRRRRVHMALWRLVLTNVEDRAWDRWERFQRWRTGSPVVGDELLDRMERLR